MLRGPRSSSTSDACAPPTFSDAARLRAPRCERAVCPTDPWKDVGVPARPRTATAVLVRELKLNPKRHTPRPVFARHAAHAFPSKRKFSGGTFRVASSALLFATRCHPQAATSLTPRTSHSPLRRRRRLSTPGSQLPMHAALACSEGSGIECCGSLPRPLHWARQGPIMPSHLASEPMHQRDHSTNDTIAFTHPEWRKHLTERSTCSASGPFAPCGP